MKKLVLREEMGRDLFTRNSLRNILYKYSDEESLLVDFENIDFVSRSCADEYLKFKDSFSGKINEENVSRNVAKILDIVKKNRNSSSKSREEIDEKKPILII